MNEIKNNLLKRLAPLLVISCVCICAFILSANTTSAATLTAKQKDKYSNKVTIELRGSEVFGGWYDGEELLPWIDSVEIDNNDISSSIINLQKSGSVFKKTLTLKKYGTYTITVDYYTKKNKYDYLEKKIKVSYVPRVTGVEIGNKSGEAILGFSPGAFKDISGGKKDGSTYYMKPGEKLNVDVLYSSADKSGTSQKAYLKWGEKSMHGSESGSFKDSGIYYKKVKYSVSSATDYEGSLTTYGTNSSRSLGCKLIIDGTKPRIKIDSAYTGKGTKYTNKTTSVPITIEEKNFDSSKTEVTINGSRTSVSWSGSGTTHTANVQLKEGKNIIEVKSTDKVGNVSDTAKSQEIIVDKKAPKVNIVGFGNGVGKGLQNGQVVKYPIKITVSDETKLGSVQVKLVRQNANGGEKEEINLQRNNKNNKVEYFTDDLADDGYYTLEVSVMDKAGNKPNSKTVKSEGKKPYTIKGNKVSGGFTVNRKGSMYKLENEKIFLQPTQPVDQIVIYEYNKSEIKKHSVEIINSRNVLPHTLTSGEYTFQKVQSDNKDYDYMYKYTISGKVLYEGRNNIEISSETEAGKNGNLIAQVVENNSINKAVVIDNTKPEILYFRQTEGGMVNVLIRERYINEDAVYVMIGSKKYKLKKDKSESSSTNILFTGEVSGNIENAKLVCTDLAGNKVESNNVEILKSSITNKILLYGGLGLGAILLISGTIVVVMLIRKK